MKHIVQFMGEKYLSVHEVAVIFGVTEKTIRAWGRSNILQGKKVGKRGDWKFTQNEVRSLIQKRKGVNKSWQQ